MSDLRDLILEELGFALLEQSADCAFALLAKAPTWFASIWGVAHRGERAALGEKSPFLENFLLEAAEFWASPSAGECRSETWMEVLPDGEAIALEARAFRLGAKRVLLVANPKAEYQQRVASLQIARNHLLDQERLAREIQKKEILLHCIVHDLSQPLSVMHVALDCIGSERVSERAAQFLNLGKLASQQQETMIREILQTFAADLRTSMEGAPEGKVTANLAETAKNSLNAMASIFAAKGVQLVFKAGNDAMPAPVVHAEESRLQRIFANLLENALRYSPPGTAVTIGIENEGESAKAYVEDQGPGLPKDLRPEQIFGLFTKGKQGGGKAGLGMYFCRITVERWGGEIGCASLPERGSRFWFRLPRVEPAPRQGPPEKKAGESPAVGERTALRILFADDQEDIRTLTQYRLERQGYTVQAVSNGAEAVRRFRPGAFDAVLLDQQMPGMTGDEAARAIRESIPKGEGVPILIASTGNSSPADEAALKEAGFDHVLPKPFQIEDLNAILSGVEPNPTKGATEARSKNGPAAMGYSQLLARVGGDEKLLQRVVAIFLRDTPKRILAMSRAVAKKDAQKTASLAHALKGSVSIFGAERARDLTEKLQDEGRSGKMLQASELFRLLKEEIAHLEENLRGYAKQARGRPPKARRKAAKGRVSRRR